MLFILGGAGLNEAVATDRLYSDHHHIKHYVAKVWGHPFKLVDSAISATPVADGV